MVVNEDRLPFHDAPRAESMTVSERSRLGTKVMDKDGRDADAETSSAFQRPISPLTIPALRVC
jgi:hypothetical protein